MALLRPRLEVPEMRWWSCALDGPRHAFPAISGGPGLHALCGVRWTARCGEPGSGDCEACRTIHRQLLAGAEPPREWGWPR